MDITRLTPTAENHTNAVRIDGGMLARTNAILPSIAQTSVAMLAPNYASSTHRSGVNHV